MVKEEEIKLGFVVSEFHRDITYQMEILGREHAEFLGAKVSITLYTPGTIFTGSFAEPYGGA